MTYPIEVREEAARRLNTTLNTVGYSEWNVANTGAGLAVCQAVLDGLLHVDPVELDRARWEEACAHAGLHDEARMQEYRHLVRKGQHPEPVDPVAQVWRDERLQRTGSLETFRAALDKLGYVITKREAGQ
jgi:hypothetical protein